MPDSQFHVANADRRLIALACLIAVVCIARASLLAWLTDDAFISFRYARNLVDGLGLVFNAGEYVEGYTNLLWTLAIAAALGLGWPAETSAHVLGIACWVALVVVLLAWSWQRARRAGRPLLPLAAALTLLLEDFQYWATGGLETSLFALLATSGLLLLAHESAPRGFRWAAGVVLGLTCLTRPDGVVFATVAVIWMFGVRARGGCALRLRATLPLLWPLIFIGGALVSFKLSYYGELLPTAFYTKSALAHYYVQGLYYIWLFFARNWFALMFLPLVLWLARQRLTALATRSDALFLAAFVAFSLYVAHSAGDYMYARRLIPALPFLWLLFEDALLACASRQVALAVFCLSLFAACLPRHLDADYPLTLRGIANEWTLFPPDYIENSRVQSAIAERLLGHLPVRGIFQGGMCMFAYHSRLPYLAEMTGLTQYSLAKQPLKRRGRIGHEKKADETWLTAHRIHMVFLHDNPPLATGGRRHFALVRFENRLTAMLWKYSDAVMDPLRNQPGVDFVPIEAVLAQAERDIGAAASRGDAERIMAFLDRYYFDDAPPARRLLAARLRQMIADKPP